MAESDDVQLTDLQVIQRYSIAVRGATAAREQVIAVLTADLEWLRGGARRVTAPSKAATAPVKPAKAPARVAKAPARSATPSAAPAAKKASKSGARRA